MSLTGNHNNLFKWMNSKNIMGDSEEYVGGISEQPEKSLSGRAHNTYEAVDGFFYLIGGIIGGGFGNGYLWYKAMNDNPAAAVAGGLLGVIFGGLLGALSHATVDDRRN